jgi:hypothetical protein
MSALYIFRFLLPTIALIGWIFYQAIIKKRKWKSLQNDALAVALFAGIWLALTFFFID